MNSTGAGSRRRAAGAIYETGVMVALEEALVGLRSDAARRL